MKILNFTKRILLVLFLTSVGTTFAQIKLPQLISDNVILQRDTELKIWGWAANGEVVTMQFQGKNFTAKTNGNGKWEVKLPAQKAGGPYNMTFNASNTIEVKNILFGDVYLCSGQSNMELPMSRLADTYAEEIKNANNSKIRQFQVPDEYEFTGERDDFSSGSWKEVNETNILEFSGVAYFFAKAIYEKEEVPIGLINSALGGSPVSAWMDKESLKEFPKFYEEHLKWGNQSYLDSVINSEQKAINKWYGDLDKKDTGLQQEWFKTDDDKTSWKEVEIPGFISGEDRNDSAGVAWFSKTVNISQLPESDKVKLHLGRLVDMDYAYVNGKQVGHTGYQYPPRKYEFDAKLLKEGENEIVVRLVNNGGITGFIEDKPYHLILDKDTLDITGTWKFKQAASMPNTPGQTFIRWKSGGLYNAMIAPLQHFELKGVLWYQGESDADDPELYAKTFPKMIESWREYFDDPELPFLLVQLPNFMEETTEPQQSSWAEMREVQRNTDLNVPHTGMAVTIDLGEWNDIHPLNKKDVGNRLALEARKLIYDEDIISSGPSPADWKIEDGAVIVNFDNLKSGWKLKNGKNPGGFTISEDGKTFHNAKAEVLDDNTLKIYNNKIKNPDVIRYAWANNPGNANLYNQEDLPAVPFEIKLTKE
ncbi:sialate O-acetylesterase [Salegentibacter sp. LM13S]|uniref:sialate O-acetylesterase n=1 Tax=Salegentibacter lacus TaxID=2873599 RepID=UPI001CC9148F|nr:sialate O-acetylesterase [Salegentibacter lacus]MBZ9631709.1 sialate O-acetylesterase [Salegentibacter lacus]